MSKLTNAPISVSISPMEWERFPPSRLRCRYSGCFLQGESACTMSLLVKQFGSFQMYDKGFLASAANVIPSSQTTLHLQRWCNASLCALPRSVQSSHV